MDRVLRRRAGGAPRRPGRHAPGRLTAGGPGDGRVLLVVDAPRGGGAEQHVVDLAVELAGRGTEVHLACSIAEAPPERLRRARVGVHELVGTLVKRRVDLGYARRLRRLVRDLDVDLVHAHVYASEVAAAVACAGTDVPLVLTEHTQAPWRGPAARAASRWTYAQASRIVAVSRAIGTMLVAEFAVPAARVRHVLPVGPVPRSGTSAAARPDGPVVGFVGRLQPEKGVDVLLDAVALVVASHPALRAVVVGDGPERDRLERRVRRLGLDRAVEFLGFRADVDPIMRGFDLLVVPSRCDGSPLVVQEAMVAGVAVVGSSVGGIPDRLEDGRLGVLVRPEDPYALAAAVAGLLADPALRAGVARRAQAAARGQTFPAMVDALVETYAEARAVAAAPLAGRVAAAAP